MPTRSSGRPSRTASRKPTPFKNATQASLATALNTPKGTDKQTPKSKAKAKGAETSNEMPEWTEPSISEIKPSYKEYDPNALANSSTLGMQPLGTLPQAKLYSKAGGSKGKGGGKGTGKSQKDKEANGLKFQDPAAKGTSQSTDPDAVMTGFDSTVEVRKSTTADATGDHSTRKGRIPLSTIVEKAVERSASCGMEVLGRAIRRLYEDSMSNPELGDLLDAVLAQEATQEQSTAFQAHVAKARESLEREFTPLGANGANSAPATPVVAPKTGNTNGTGKGKIILKVPLQKEEQQLQQQAHESNIRGTRRSSRRLQEHRDVSAQADSASEASANSSLDGPPFPVGPSEPSTPPATVIQGIGKSKEPNATNRSSYDSEYVKARVEAHYLEVLEKYRNEQPSDIGLIKTSTMRTSLELEDTDDESATEAGIGVSTRASVKKADTTNPRKRALSTDNQTPPPPASSGTSVAEPPEVGGPPKKKRQTRVKSSPMKPKMDQFADLSSRGQRIGSEAVSENDEWCCVCNGSGKFLCCDRCPKSFHFLCVNPPTSESELPKEAWYCQACTAQMNPPERQPRGLFGPLLDDQARKNPVIYSLPESIKTYFEGVQCGAEGEYMELPDNKPTRRGGFVEDDHYKTKDKNGQPIFCYRCGLSSLGGKRILSCDFCSLYWHLDCINPPPANPPAPTRKWKCPAHAEQGLLQPRRPRNAKVVDSCLRRGHRNNGYIEIESSESEEEMVFTEREEKGVIYRLPERGIKLDFIDKMRTLREPPHYDGDSNASKRRRISDAEYSAGNEMAMEPSVAGRSRDEVATALSLYLLGHSSGDPVPGALGETSKLITALIANAPPSVQALFDKKVSPPASELPQSSVITSEQQSNSSAGSPNVGAAVLELQRKQLKALMELLQNSMAMLDGQMKP